MQIPGYRVIRKINQGGMSTVYLAIQISVGRVVALKVMSPTLNGDPAFSERFQREANIVGQLSHPNIVAIYDIGRHESLNYIAMDYLPGGSVHDQMMKGISTVDALRITREMAIALDHAHEKGYIHRDIKPENILFRADGSAVLTDFGVAKGIIGVSRMTNVGQVVGTPHYMSPEQTRGKTVDARSDLYSLGVVFYEMLTGSVPFQGDEAVAIAIKHISAPVPRLPRQYQAYQKILDKLLAKDPEHRFQRGRDIAEAIEAVENSHKAAHPNAIHPGEQNILALFQALVAAASSALRARLDYLLRLRWTPQQGFYRHPTTRMTEVLFIGEDDRSTLVATRTQTATHFQALLNPRQRLGMRIALGLLLIVVIWSGVRLLLPSESGDELPATSMAQQGSTEQQNSVVDQTSSTADLAPPLEDTSQAQEVSALGNTSQVDTADGQIVDMIDTPAPSKADSEEPVESAATVTIEREPASFPLTVRPTPENALVRILNIVPRYAPGIELTAGRYHIEVSHPGYLTRTEWVELKNTPLITAIELKPAPVRERKFASTLANGTAGPRMVTINAGSFTMGKASNSHATPVHRVTLGKPFAISETEITFAQYEQFAKATDRALPGDNRWGRDNRPVINVSWEDSQAYARWLSQQTGERYRLPTESEWEYVARAGSSTDFWWGDNASEAPGKVNCRRGCNSRFSGLFGSKTAPTGSYSPNAFGVYDTAGNVAEWVQDCYVDNYALKPKNGSAFETADCPTRVVRGGSAKDSVEQIASHVRDYHPPEIYEEHLGFRLVMELE